MKKLSIIVVLLVLLLLSCNLMNSSNNQNTLPTAETIVITVVSSPTTDAGASVSPTDVPASATAAAATTEDVAVVFVMEGDVLNVRSAAGVSNPIEYTIPPLAANVTFSGILQQVGNSQWAKVSLPGKPAGWVNSWFLTATKSSADFCADGDVDTLISDFLDAVKTQNVSMLKPLVSKTHGLVARHEWWNNGVHYPFNNIQNIFSDATTSDFGFADGSGLPIIASFKDTILQPMTDDLTSAVYSKKCNEIESGPTAGYVVWPYEYSNINYISLHIAGSATYDGMDWSTWVIGVEYINGKPYVVTIINYHWEI
jgi:hypothetical protein